MKNILLALAITTLAAPAFADVTIVDGDTVKIDGKTIRIVQIDTPELNGHCEAEVENAMHAANRLRELLATGNVTYKATGTDRYGRTLAKVYVGKTDVGKAMIKEGYALPYQPGAEAKLKRVQTWCPSVTSLDYDPASKPMQFAASKKQASQEDGDVYYQNCSAARAAGAAPISYGEPGYRAKLDRDSDGIACE